MNVLINRFKGVARIGKRYYTQSVFRLNPYLSLRLLWLIEIVNLKSFWIFWKQSFYICCCNLMHYCWKSQWSSGYFFLRLLQCFAKCAKQTHFLIFCHNLLTQPKIMTFVQVHETILNPILVLDSITHILFDWLLRGGARKKTESKEFWIFIVLS